MLYRSRVQLTPRMTSVTLGKNIILYWTVCQICKFQNNEHAKFLQTKGEKCFHSYKDNNYVFFSSFNQLEYQQYQLELKWRMKY